MATNPDQDFEANPSEHQHLLASESLEKQGHAGLALTTLFVGISVAITSENTAVVAIAIRDIVYLQDFSIKNLDLNSPTESIDHVITDHIITELASYERKMLSKYLGCGMPYDLMQTAPSLSSRLWAELDTVPISIRPDEEGHHTEAGSKQFWDIKTVDEQADSMARKCIMYFGPNDSPLLQVGYRGSVEVDAGYHSQICTVEDYRATCGETTWKSTVKFAEVLKEKNIKIAFFSSTPQGGGVALMRHALVRFARTIGVKLDWYVPKPKPGVFRITKNIHNILQGVADPELRISSEEKQDLADWIKDNATRYWLTEGGPLRAESEGGANIIIDDPQMPGLIPLAKAASPDRPILYRSHIQIRSDLADQAGTPQADIWEFLWGSIKHADMFISHPISSFVPRNVDRSKVAYMPATTDWLDGLNKNMNFWDEGYYTHNFNVLCHSVQMTPLRSLKNKYFIQIARFDPSKGIPDVIKAYVEFHRLLDSQSVKMASDDIPQLLIVGNSSVDDPDATQVYDSTLSLIRQHCPQLSHLISVMRLPASDQILNTLISNAFILLQLSTREGFEVKVSEGLHKGRPVIASKVGGIPLQVEDHQNGWLVEAGDWRTVGAKMFELWIDDSGKWDRMSEAARGGVSDEVGTVGNALCWLWLAVILTKDNGQIRGKPPMPKERWVNDMAREDAGYPYVQGENRLPRATTA